MFNKKTLALLCLAFLLLAGNSWAQPLKQKEVLETLTKVNGYFMKKYADYRLPSFYKKMRPSNIWTRTVYYEGLLSLYSIYPLDEYYDYAYGWADFHDGASTVGRRPAMRTTTARDRFTWTSTASARTMRKRYARHAPTSTCWSTRHR